MCSISIGIDGDVDVFVVELVEIGGGVSGDVVDGGVGGGVHGRCAPSGSSG
jgi:hypothetical protein